MKKNIVLISLLLWLVPNFALALPVPRFVSIKSSRMNSRIGPGFDYPVIWHYWRKNMPIEIIEEYDQWRKIKDIDGDISWVYQALLSGSRSAIIQAKQDQASGFLPILATPHLNAHIISKIEDGAIVNIKTCDGNWCYINIQKISGYVPQNKLWGVYKGEIVK